MLRNLGKQGQPMGRTPDHREDWTSGLEFPYRGSTMAGFRVPVLVAVRRVRRQGQKTTRAGRPCLHQAGVSFASSARQPLGRTRPRRIGNGFVFQMLPQQNVETLTPQAYADRGDLSALLQHPVQRVRQLGGTLKWYTTRVAVDLMPPQAHPSGPLDGG